MIQIFFIILVVAIIYWLLTSAKKTSFQIPSHIHIHIASLKKDLFLSTHSYQRIIERGITLKELKNMLESEDSVAVVQKNGRIRISNGTLTAILGADGEELVLVTTFRNSSHPQNDRQQH